MAKEKKSENQKPVNTEAADNPADNITKVTLSQQTEAATIGDSIENKKKAYFLSKIAIAEKPETKAELLAIGLSEAEAAAQIATDIAGYRKALAIYNREVSGLRIQLKSGNPMPESVAKELTASIIKTLDNAFEIVTVNAKSFATGRATGFTRGNLDKVAKIHVPIETLGCTFPSRKDLVPPIIPAGDYEMKIGDFCDRFQIGNAANNDANHPEGWEKSFTVFKAEAGRGKFTWQFAAIQAEA